MKKLLLTLAMLLIVGQAWAWKPKFVGHRGSYKGVMNTEEAFRNGVDYYGYDGLECDVRVTADGKYVISHDETTNAVGGNAPVYQYVPDAAEAAGIQMILGGITMLEIDHILAKQFALDYHCKPEDFNNSDTLVTE